MKLIFVDYLPYTRFLFNISLPYPPFQNTDKFTRFLEFDLCLLPVVGWNSTWARAFFHKTILSQYTLHSINCIFKCTTECILKNVDFYITVAQSRWRILLSPPQKSPDVLCVNTELKLPFVMLFVTVNSFVVSGIICKWNHTVQTPLCMASFTQWNIFEIYLCPCMYQQFKILKNLLNNILWIY